MKARVKATGEIVDVKSEAYIANGRWDVGIRYVDIDKNIYYERDLDFENITQEKVNIKEKSLPKNELDYWEKLKHQYAGMAMQGLLSNSAYLENFIKYSVEGDSLARVVSTNAIDYATALVNRLKEDKL